MCIVVRAGNAILLSTHVFTAHVSPMCYRRPAESILWSNLNMCLAILYLLLVGYANPERAACRIRVLLGMGSAGHKITTDS
jgi:hypothetical protein